MLLNAWKLILPLFSIKSIGFMDGSKCSIMSMSKPLNCHRKIYCNDSKDWKFFKIGMILLNYLENFCYIFL